MATKKDESQVGPIRIAPDIEGLEFLRDDFEVVEYLQDLLISHATGGVSSDDEYKLIRGYLIGDKNLEYLLPDFVRTKRNLGQFWNFIKPKFSTYAMRREFLWNSFSELLGTLEDRAGNAVTNNLASNQTLKFGVNSIHLEVQKALDRVIKDPEGAITLARTILESTCKFIADQKQIAYSDETELSTLYKQVAKKLNMSPEQHSEEIFKQILGGCSAIVNGLGTLRNKLGDAHGKSSKAVKPSSRHAELAVNLAGTMAIFLLQTHQ